MWSASLFSFVVRDTYSFRIVAVVILGAGRYLNDWLIRQPDRV
jgi:hypothetical protein